MKGRRGKRLFHLDRFGRRTEESLDEEVEFHLESRIRTLVSEGMTPEEARKEALRRFGDPELVLQRCRRIDQGGVRRRIFSDLLGDLLKDIRHTLRGLRRTPGFALVATLSLAVGIGVNSALFTTIQAVWLAPVPGVTDQERIVDMVPVIRGEDSWAWAYPDFQRVRDANTPFEALAAWAERDATLGSGEGGRRIRVAYATPEYFQVLGAQPVMGRGFLDAEDEAPGQHPVAVVGHDFWKGDLEGRDDVLGHSLLLDGVPHTVIGVAGPGFVGARVNRSSVDLWVPLFQHPQAAGDPSMFSDQEADAVQVLGRLRPGATLSEARAAVQTVFAGLAAEFPETHRFRTVKAVKFGRFPAQNRIYDMVGVVGICGLVAVLLLIICGNLAGMALARSAAKEQEIGVRLALGSTRVRLIRHLMLEAGILTVVGGGGGIALAMLGMARVSPMDLGISAPGATFQPSGWTLGMSLVLAFVAAQTFGLLPALRYSRPELVSALKDDAGGGGRRVGRFQRYASSIQTGTSFLLLLLAALFLRSLERIDESRMGFRPEGLAVADFRTGGTFLGLLELAEEGYPSLEEGGSALLDGLLEEAAAKPGVSSVAVATGFPLDRRRAYLTVLPAREAAGDSVGIRVEFTRVSEGYLETLQTPFLQGRGILRSDDGSAPQVAVVTRSFGDRLWPGEDPLGRTFSRAGAPEPSVWTVVGVVADVASSVAKEDYPQVFLPLRQGSLSGVTLLVRSDPGYDTGHLAGQLREVFRSVDSGLPLPTLLPAPTLVAQATQEQLTGGQVAGGIGILVLLLSAMGVYGVVALMVAGRTREIGLRMAMGASREGVISGVLKDSLRMAAPGLVGGGLLAVATALALRSMLLGLSPVDPVALVSVGALLLLVVLAASLAPALRAAGIQPMRALRKD